MLWSGRCGLFFRIGQRVAQLCKIAVQKSRGEAAERISRTREVIRTGFAAQYLPWVLVPRSTFIYHYFASVPFIILATVAAIKTLEGRSKKAARIAAIVLLVCALVLFIAFYPLESGLPTLRAYAKYLRWFNWYNY